MELLQITLAANETKQFAKAGRYFEIIESAFPITVNFTGSSGALSDSMVNALSGLFLEDAYTHFSITNGTSAQTVTLLLMEIGRGGSRRQPGVVQVTYQVSSSVALSDSVETANALASGFQVVKTIVTPAANTKGLRMHRCVVQAVANAAGFTDLRVIAAPAAPVNLTPANSFQLAGCGSTNGVSATDTQVRMNLSLPPGWGLFLACNNGGTVPPQTIYQQNSYELLV